MTDCVIMDDHVRKIYIDSPIFTHEDEERFRYISTNVDDAVTGRTNADELETLIEDALGPPMKTAVPTGGNARSYQDRSPRPFDSLDDEEVAIGRAPGGPIDLSRYEDFNGDRVNHYDQFIYDPAGLPQEPHPPRFRQERPSPGSQPGHMAMQRMNKDVNDIQPFTGQDEAEDYAEARLERQRQHRQARQAHVPQLDLIESEDETGDGRAALDLELNEGRMSHVSKFSHNHGGPQSNSVHGYKHPNEHSQSTQQTAGQKYFGRQQQPVRNSENHPDGDYVQDSLEVAQTYRRLGDNGGNPYYARTLIGDNYGAGNTVPPNHLQDEYAPNTRPMRQMVSNERPPHSNTGSAVSSAAGSRVLNRHNHLPPSSNFVPETAVSEQEHTERDNNTGPDFIEANRQNVKKPLKTYGQIYSRRKGKENAETNEMPTRRQSESDSYRRPDKVTGHPATADERRTLSQQQVAENGTSGEQSDLSAEHLWHARSRILAAKKEAGSVGGSSSSATSKSRRRDTAPPLHKYPSDTQMETGPSLMPSTGASSAPYQRSAGSYGTAAAMAAHPPSPQKVSVDINLNVISPRNSLNQPSAMQFRLGGQHGGGHPDGGRGQVYDGVPSVSHVSVAAQPQTYHLVSSTGFVSPSAVYSGTLPMQAVGDGGHYVISQQPPFVGPFVMPQHNHNDVYLAANGGSRMAFQDQPNNLQQAYLPIRYSYNMPQPMVAQPMQSAHHYQYQVSIGPLICVTNCSTCPLTDLIVCNEQSLCPVNELLTQLRMSMC